MPRFVFTYSGHDPEAFVVDAESPEEAIGKATEANHGIRPLGDPQPLEELMDGEDAVRLV